LNQLGPDSLASLRKLAESYQQLNLDSQRVPSENTGDDDDIPELVDNFEATSEQKKKDEVPAAASTSASGSGTSGADATTTEKVEVDDVD
jgi:nascent polypeptide-associated complex subunit beta